MNANVLIVDDIVENREIIKSILDAFPNVTIAEGKNGKEAIELARSNAFDLILMDVKMPEMDGYESAKEIRNMPHNRNAKIIFISAYESEKQHSESVLDLGGVDFILKPINVNELKKLFTLYLRFIVKEKEYFNQLSETNKYLQEEIVKRKKFEVQFLKTRESFKNIVEKSEAAILIVDNDGIIRFLNKSAEIIFGRASEELINEPFGYVVQFDSKTEINILRRDGTIGVGELTTTLTNWENEQAWLLLINDITEHKQLEEKLLKAKEKAQESDKLKSAFLSNMSHEIRTPMNGILGFLDFIDTEEDIEKRKYFTDIIRSSGNHLLNLINDIIDISKIESGQLNVKSTECKVDSVLKNLFDFFKNNPEIIRNNIDFRLNYPREKEKTIIQSDPDRLNQILINLIGNAIKFTTSGYIEFGYCFKTDVLEFFVKDTGNGIPEDRISDIFNRFSQVASHNISHTQGTGLGLAISKSLVELLGGIIWVESKINEGSTFYFTLPKILYKKDYPIVTEKDTGKNKSTSVLTGKNALIVEDEEFNYQLLDSILKMIGMQTQRASTGIDAVELAKKNDFDIILMDIKMPIMNGLEATKKIRESGNNIPIIAQTAYALEGEKHNCLRAGCNDYIAKPIVQSELIEKIKNYLT